MVCFIRRRVTSYANSALIINKALITRMLPRGVSGLRFSYTSSAVGGSTLTPVVVPMQMPVAVMASSSGSGRSASAGPGASTSGLT